MTEYLRSRLSALLSRKTTSGRFIPEIDGLRFVAIWSVVLFHLYVFVTKKLALEADDDWLARVLSKGFFGVQLFFVISGFIISLPFAQGERAHSGAPSLGSYYKRRLTRLEPPYVLNLLLIAALLLLIGRHSFSELVPHFLASVTYTHNFIYETPSIINGVAWTLEIECQFYVVAPLLATAFKLASRWQRRLVLVAAIALATAAAQLLVPHTPLWQQALPAHLNYFLCGFLLADVFAARPAEQRQQRSYAWDGLGALCWALMLVLLLAPKELRWLLPLPVTLACYSAFRGCWSGAIFGHPFVYTIGGMCYTLYLYHSYVLSLGGGMLVRVPGLEGLPVWLLLCLASVLLVPLVLLVCVVFFVLTEKPFMNPGWPAAFAARWHALSRRKTLRPPAPVETARTPR
jgi:peptidoglycan/LPS O-acetylase OafA/YrhL